MLVWKLGERGSTAKVGPCWVVLQNGHTVWVTRCGELWKCNVAQVFEMSNADIRPRQRSSDMEGYGARSSSISGICRIHL